MGGQPPMHGEPDAWKPARPVRREGWRNLSPKGDVALHLYSTAFLPLATRVGGAVAEEALEPGAAAFACGNPIGAFHSFRPR